MRLLRAALWLFGMAGLVTAFFVLPYQAFATLPTTAPSPTVTSTPQPSHIKIPTATPNDVTADVTALQSLNVRAGPDVTFRVLAVLSSGRRVAVISECRAGWVRIRFDDRTGWVNADYLSGNLCK